jgi:hypothetical protein
VRGEIRNSEMANSVENIRAQLDAILMWSETHPKFNAWFATDLASQQLEYFSPAQERAIHTIFTKFRIGQWMIKNGY